MKKNNLFNLPEGGFIGRHPVLANVIIIIIIAFLGLLIAYLCTAIFTKHGQQKTVPKVEAMSYTDAIKKLHDEGFRVDIRDSLYRDDVKPGYVIEQFPKANSIVKPGRKIFLYINAVHPKEVVIDDDNHPREPALKSYSLRQGLAHLEELGFKNIRIVKVLGENDCIVKVLANGRTVYKTQKVPLTARIIVEVYDGRLADLRDSLQSVEMSHYPVTYIDAPADEEDYYPSGSNSYEESPSPGLQRYEGEEQEDDKYQEYLQ